MFLLYVFAFAVLTASPACGRTQLKVFVTNDVHGFVQEHAAARQMGFPRFKGYIEATEAKGFGTILLDAGDAFSGSAFAQFDRGVTVARLMRLMGYRAMVPGNHIFDFNAETGNALYASQVLLPAVTGGKPDSFTATAVNIAYAGKAAPGIRQEPLIVHDETGSDPEGVRVIVAGVLNPDVVGNVKRKLLRDYDFGRAPSTAETRTRIMNMLEKALQPYSRPNDIVIVLSHSGYWKKTEQAGQLTGKDLARVPNVKVVVDGHSHRAIRPERIGSAWYVNGGRYLEHFTEITVERDAGKDASVTVALQNPETVAGCAPSRAVDELVGAVARARNFDRALFTLKSENPAYFTTSGISNGDKPLGRLFTSLMRLAAGADAAFYSSGSFRMDILPGQVTVKHIHDVIPFAGELVAVNLSGEQLGAVLAARLRPGRSDFPQISGVTVFAYPYPEKKNARLAILAILDGRGKPLDSKRSIRVAMSASTLGAAAKQGAFEAASASRVGPACASIVDYLENHPGLSGERLAATPGLRVFPSRAEAEKALKKYQARAHELAVRNGG